MSYTRLQVYNMALWNLGIKTQLQSTEGDDPKAVALNVYYDNALNVCLKANDWGFARCYRTLALTSAGKSQNPLYRYEFDYPDDCLSAREIVSLDKDINIDFEPATNSITQERVINTNVPEGILRYTKKIDKETFFTPEFVHAFSWYLSFLICDSIGFPNKKEIAMKTYSETMQNAIISDANEGFEDKEKEPSYISVRSD